MSCIRRGSNFPLFTAFNCSCRRVKGLKKNNHCDKRVKVCVNQCFNLRTSSRPPILMKSGYKSYCVLSTKVWFDNSVIKYCYFFKQGSTNYNLVISKLSFFKQGSMLDLIFLEGKAIKKLWYSLDKSERLLSVTFQTSFYGNFDFLGN